MHHGILQIHFESFSHWTLIFFRPLTTCPWPRRKYQFLHVLLKASRRKIDSQKLWARETELYLLDSDNSWAKVSETVPFRRVYILRVLLPPCLARCLFARAAMSEKQNGELARPWSQTKRREILGKELRGQEDYCLAIPESWPTFYAAYLRNTVAWAAISTTRSLTIACFWNLWSAKRTELHCRPRFFSDVLIVKYRSVFMGWFTVSCLEKFPFPLSSSCLFSFVRSWNWTALDYWILGTIAIFDLLRWLHEVYIWTMINILDSHRALNFLQNSSRSLVRAIVDRQFFWFSCVNSHLAFIISRNYIEFHAIIQEEEAELYLLSTNRGIPSIGHHLVTVYP